MPDNIDEDGRIIDIEPLGEQNTQEILEKWQEIKAPVEEAIDRIWRNLEYKLKPLRYDAEDVLSVFKWILAITIGLCLERSFTLSYQVFLSDESTLAQIKNNGLYRFVCDQLGMKSPDAVIHGHPLFIRTLVFVMLCLFLVDAFRVLVPLPWIFKSFRKRTIKDAAPQSFALPAFDVSKLVFISITTIYIFFFAAQTFFLINVYFLCILLAQCLDFLWYISLTKVKPPKNPRVLTEAAFKNIENCQETLNQKLTKMIVNKMKSITKHRAIQEPSDITAVKKAAGILEAVLNEQLSKLTTHNANRADEFRKKVPGLLRKWQEYIKAKAQIESEVRVRNEGSLIAAWKLFSCLAVLSLQLPFHSRIRPSIILLIIAMGILSHIANIAYDYWRNHDEYYSTLMLLYKPHAPQNFSPLGNDTGVLLTDITREP